MCKHVFFSVHAVLPQVFSKTNRKQESHLFVLPQKTLRFTASACSVNSLDKKPSNVTFFYTHAFTPLTSDTMLELWWRFTQTQWWTTTSFSGNCLNFMDPSTPQEKRWFAGPTATCVTPDVEPTVRKKVFLLCSPGKEKISWCTSSPQTWATE